MERVRVQWRPTGVQSWQGGGYTSTGTQTRHVPVDSLPAWMDGWIEGLPPALPPSPEKDTTP